MTNGKHTTHLWYAWGMVDVLPTLLGAGVSRSPMEPIPCRLGTQGHMHLHRTRACHHLVDPSHADVAWQVTELLDQVLPFGDGSKPYPRSEHQNSW
jgi:hypothetical protein